MSPEYFHTRLTISEANDYIEGLAYRYRPSWQQARLVADVSARCAGNKHGIGMTFPWEKEERAEAQRPPTEEEMKELNEFRERIEKSKKK